jgi:hypothetical protein
MFKSTSYEPNKAYICSAKDTANVIEKLKILNFSDMEIDLILSNIFKTAAVNQIFNSIPENFELTKNPLLYKNSIKVFTQLFPVLDYLYHNNENNNEL